VVGVLMVCFVVGGCDIVSSTSRRASFIYEMKMMSRPILKFSQYVESRTGKRNLPVGGV
jgi:hypothetical protein